MSLDSISTARLQLVNPALTATVVQMSEMLGFAFRVTQGFRTWADQDAIYAQGRTTPGQIVTNAKGGESWHNYGVAVDLVPMNPLPDWNVQHPVWQQMIQCGKSLGLYSGSDFVVLKDWPHFQFTGRFPTSPNAEAKQIYANQGQQAFWNEVNAKQ